ncbi:acetyltransferase [Pelagibacterium sp.]|uniref:acetyltransferase n=1 Tax=Pelagibacterium sp. TaxID=1967288 RepID=UPI003A8DF6B8
MTSLRSGGGVMRRLAVIGAGGHGRVVAEAADMAGWTVLFFDDHAAGHRFGWPVCGPVAALLADPEVVDGAIVAIGNNRLRLELTHRLMAAGMPMPAIVHPATCASLRANLGAGTFLAAGAVVSIGATLGIATIINTGASVDHDCTIADGVHLSPGVRLSGLVTIGECTWLGTGSNVRNDIVIGRDSIIGVGAAVVADIGDGVVAQGVPARVVRANPAAS